MSDDSGSSAGNTNRRGIGLMMASMVMFTIADSLVKVSTATHSPAQVMLLLFGGALVLFTTMAVINGDKLFDRDALVPVLLWRYIAEIIGMVGMITALALVPISTVGAVTQATPILAALGAVYFLNEQIGWQRWVCIGVGFAGVLMIVQPAASSFNSAVLWAVLALIALSVRDLTTRLVPSGMASNSLATYTMIAATPVALVWVLVRGENLVPIDTNWFIVLPMIVSGAMGYMLLISSLRTAAVSVVMPFRYSRVVFLLGAGILVFDERPNALMLAGAFLIVVSGAYMMHREQLVKGVEKGAEKNSPN